MIKLSDGHFYVNPEVDSLSLDYRNGILAESSLEDVGEGNEWKWED